MQPKDIDEIPLFLLRNVGLALTVNNEDLKERKADSGVSCLHFNFNCLHCYQFHESVGKPKREAVCRLDCHFCPPRLDYGFTLVGIGMKTRLGKEN